MIQVTATQLAAILVNATANLFGSLEYLAPLEVVKKHRKTGQPTSEIVPEGKLFKYTYTTMKTVEEYQQAVRNAALREAALRGGTPAEPAPEFVAKQQLHFDHYQDSPVVMINRTTGVFALLIAFHRRSKTHVEFRDINGKVYTYEEVEGILPKGETREGKEKARERNAENQGLTEEFPVRTYRCDRMIRLSYQNETYEIIPETSPATFRETPETETETP
jgi:hypothetical protein